MFNFAIFVGIYSYLIFFLGVLHVLTKEKVLIVSVLWLVALFWFNRKRFFELLLKLPKLHFNIKQTYKSPVYLLLILIILQALINLIGALGPELAFDALWYHLTLPKLYLLNHAIYHIPGGLLYYSDMPKLGEMLYIGALSFGNEIGAKLIHFSFGILIAVSLYKFSRKFFNQKLSLLIVVIFYSNLVVDWESITAYNDLTRTFFELLALWAFINWYETWKNKWLVVSGLMMGLAITTKLLAIGSFFILLLLLVAVCIFKKSSLKDLLTKSFIFSLIAFIVPLPWFIFSYSNTGDPIYPFFSPYFTAVQGKVFSIALLNPINFLEAIWNVLIHASDPISPIYIILLPWILIFIYKMSKSLKIIGIYFILSFLFWYMTSGIEGSRLLLPYLPALTLLCGMVIQEFYRKKYKKVYIISMIVIVFVSVISIGYRGIANAKYVPFILGKETKATFLTNNLNFGFGDFYDTDSYFANRIKPTDTVLLYGFHNLYYIDFPYIDSTWVKKGDRFKYIATQKTKLPTRFMNWQLLYSNDKTMVQLFKPPKGACSEICYY